MKKILLMTAFLFMVACIDAKTAYIVWQQESPSEGEVWINSNYYIWENTYKLESEEGALKLMPAGKGWIGGGYSSTEPFDNASLADGYDLVFDIRSSGKKELSVLLTNEKPEASQSVKLDFARDGEWHTMRLNVEKCFPKIYEVWKLGGNGYVFSIAGGATDGEPVYLRNIHYETSVMADKQ